MYHAFTTAEIIGWFVVYGVIAFLAVSGNILVVYVVCTRPKLQNVPNFFIVNLAASSAHELAVSHCRWPTRSRA